MAANAIAKWVCNTFHPGGYNHDYPGKQFEEQVRIVRESIEPCWNKDLAF